MDAEVEEAARWRRLGRLDFQAGLREGGFSEKAISTILKYVPWSSDRIVGLFRDDEMVEVLSTVEDGRAVLLAVLGRGDTCLKRLSAQGYCSPTDHLYPKEATALCVNLSANANLKELDVSRQTIFNSRKGCRLLGNALRTNAMLQRLELEFVGIGSEAVRCLMDGLKGNRTLEVLDLRWNPLLDEGIAYVAEGLSSNTSLRTLDISHTQSGVKGAKHVSSALERNTTLETLRFSGNKIGRDGMKILLQPLSLGVVGELATALSGQRNTTLKELELQSMDLEDFSVESLAWMLRTSKTLSKLDIGPNPLTPQDWVDHIFPALRENETLKELSLFGCKGLTGGAVHDGLMDLLQFSNTGLSQIQLYSSGLQTSQGQIDEELRVNREYRSRLRGETPVQAKSGRLVLCGFEFAGKTTIRKTMEGMVHGLTCAHSSNAGWRKLRKAFGRNVSDESADRTRGFDIVVFNKQSYRTSVWDSGGQKEYYTFHDYLFTDIHKSCFLYVCNPHSGPDRQCSKGKLKKQCTMREECEYWMRFLASKCKPRHGLELPHVRFVLTNKDTLSSSRLDVAKQRADRVVVQLKEVFKDVIYLCETVEVVNAHCCKDVESLMMLTNASLKTILTHQTDYAICDEVRNVLHGWSAKNPSKPVVSLHEFYTLCEDRWKSEAPIAKRRSKEDWEVVLNYLHDLAEIIYYKGSSLIVANPRWFGVGVLGVLIDAFRGGEALRSTQGSDSTGLFSHRKRVSKLDHYEGFVERHSLEDLLEHSIHAMHLKQSIPSGKLIQLMLQLEMCFEKEPGKVDSSLFIPALFEDETVRAANGTRPLEWKLERTGPLTFLGRRLECLNKSTTFLTPDFFPRLQVHLRNYIHERGWMGNRGFAVDRNLICFAENGMEVCVEYGGDSDQFVDILVRSSKSYPTTLSFIEEHVVKKILQFCASPRGCEGVCLAEAVIRPVCVRNLHLCIDRKAHSVLISTLQVYLESDRGYQHTWSHVIEDEKGTDLALDLLEGEGSYMAFLAENQMHLVPAVLGSILSNPSFQCKEVVSGSISSNPSFRYKEVVSGSISSNPSFRYLEDLDAYHQLPRLFYPTIEDVGMLRKGEARMNLAKVMSLKLHLLCEAKDGPHKVEGQSGRLIKLNWKVGGGNLPIMKYAVILLWAGVGVDTSMAGASGVLPPVDNWVQKLLDVPTMSVTVERLFHIVSHGNSGEISEQEILKVLERYLKIDPSTQWLEGFLNLQDGDKFWRDFGLRKVVCTDVSHRSEVVWLCEHHFESGQR